MLWPFENMRGLKTENFRENQKQDRFLTEVFMDGTNSNIYPIYPKIILPGRMDKNITRKITTTAVYYFKLF